jgi:beta-N-acetylhexosaminidase
MPRMSVTRRRATLALACAIAAATSLGCAASTTPSAGQGKTPAATGPFTPAPTVEATPTSVPTCAARTLASMSEPQRIGQLFMIGLRQDQLDAAEIDGIASYHFGSMAFTTHSSAGVAGVRAITDSVQALATVDATDGVGFFVAANQEGGLIQGLSGAGFDVIPSAVDQGKLDVAALQQMASRWGRELGDAGVNLDLAPVADVVPAGTDATNAPIGKLRREYGHTPAIVSSHVSAFVAGMMDAGIATTVKHFPGLGRVVGNTDFTDDVRDAVTVRDDPDLGPFAAAIDADVPFVMVSLATYERIDPDRLAVFSPTVMEGMLRDDLKFHGVVISDALGATAVNTIPAGTRAVDFIAAGGDMIISNQLAPAVKMAKSLAARAADDATFAQRIDSAALRVLDAKKTAGLLPCG